MGIGPFLTTDFDILYLAQSLVHLIPVPVIGKWFKGHFTGKVRLIQHDMNQRADDLANKFLQTHPRAFSPKRLLASPPRYQVRLLYDNSDLTSQYYKTLASLLHEGRLQQHILKKTNWMQNIFDSVDWASHQRAFHRLTRFKQITIAELIHQLVNTNRQNKLCYKTSNLCPICGSQEETLEHVFTCTASDAVHH
jgi:hypothetical protein